MRITRIPAAGVILVALACGAPPPPPVETAPRLEWDPIRTDVAGSFRGFDGFGREVVWASGTAGTVLRSVDAGRTWQTIVVPGAEELDLRDIEAFGADEAIAVSAGSPARFYLTSDAGQSWTLTHEDTREEIFLDAMSFWDRSHGIAFGDPIDGRFVVLVTEDGGQSWLPVPDEGLPPALEGEAGFAASGSCLITLGEGHVWFGTGGSAARVFRSEDRGRSWSVAATPIVAGESSTGIFSLAFADELHGVAVGGNYSEPERTGPNVALTDDGGATWRVPEALEVGFRSAVSYAGDDGGLLVAVGSHGGDFSTDGGRHWTSLGDTGFHALAVPTAPSESSASASSTDEVLVWAIGAGGRVGRLLRR